MSTFDARGYWEQRLGSDWSLRGVGFRRLGPSFNAWAYRVRGEVFDRVAREHVPGLAAAEVLDVGSGTGFYLDAWRQLGARRVTGLDLTEAAAARLRERFPDLLVLRADISAGPPELPGPVDAVSAMDVLFHVVDDAKFAAALANVFAVLRPGGVFLWSDGFLHGRERRARHVVWRRLADSEGMVRAAGFEVVGRVPMFVLMNPPYDARNRLVSCAWHAAAGLISLADPLGEFAGKCLFGLESRLVRTRPESPSTEIMICRRTT